MLVPGSVSAAGPVCIYDKVPEQVVASRCADGLYKELCIAVDAVVCQPCNRLAVAVRRGERGEAPGIERVKHLVVGLEQKLVSVVFECLRNLPPEGAVTLFCSGIVYLAGDQPGSAGGSGVVMDVKDAVHPFVYHVIYNFLNPYHPLGIYGGARPGGHIPFVLVVQGDGSDVGIPGYGYAD